MSMQHLTYFKIENFKLFDNLEVNDIGPINLIVGDNNVGKTTFLESLLFDETNSLQFLANLWFALNTGRQIGLPLAYQMNFIDFYYNKTSTSKKIKYTIKYDNNIAERLTIEGKALSNLTSIELEAIKSKLIIHSKSQFLVKFELGQNTFYEFTTFGDENTRFTQYVPLAWYGLSYQSDLIQFFSDTVQNSTKEFNNLINSLKFFIPNILTIEISYGIAPNLPSLIIREKNIDEPSPISLYGDGINKLLRYILEILKCRDKRLMIDEIDTGIHHSRMKEFWVTIMRIAKENNVQLFATTHSKECLEAYTLALKELNMQEKARVIRLADTKSGIKAYTMRFDEFENALEVESEIR